jgi:hypothetical protein
MFPSTYSPPGRGPVQGIKTYRATPVQQVVPEVQPQAIDLLPTGMLKMPPAAGVPQMVQRQMLPLSSPTPAAGGSAVLNGLKSAGTAIKDNPMAAVAAAQGVAGALSFATAKAPKPLAAPKAYQPTIRGAQGLEATSYEQTRQDILTGQHVASAPLSADASTNVVQKLLASREAGKNLNNLATQNNAAYQQDVRRVDSQEKEVYDRNYTQQRGYEENKFNDERRQYEARRLQSQAQVQGAVDTLGGMYQNSQQDKQLVQEGKNRQAEASIKQIHTDLASATSPDEVKLLLDKLGQLDPQGLRTQQAQTRYGKKLAAGGALPTAVGVEFKAAKPGKTGTAAKPRSKSGGAGKSPVSVQSFHEMSKDFSNRLARFNQQATQHFQRSLEAAMRLRSTAIPSSLHARR